jgi:5-methylcytosine-specific restriction endonuclease McrA
MAKIKVRVPDGYDGYLSSPQWFKFREQVLLYWDYKCALCCSPRALHVHHRTYKRLGNERLNDCVALCADCHKMVTRRRKRLASNGKAWWLDG